MKLSISKIFVHFSPHLMHCGLVILEYDVHYLVSLKVGISFTLLLIGRDLGLDLIR